LAKKKRIPIPEKDVDELLVSCKHLCCICERPFVKIHHIDGDPSNNDPDNIIPLCGWCHDLVVAIVDNARKYTERQLKLYRDKHIEKYSKFPQPDIVKELEELNQRVENMEAHIGYKGDYYE
jgi:uncharacterized NAD-dependent epimerase/dehydratase family protein